MKKESQDFDGNFHGKIPMDEYTPVQKGAGLMNSIDRENPDVVTYEAPKGYGEGSKGVDSLGIPKGSDTNPYNRGRSKH